MTMNKPENKVIPSTEKASLYNDLDRMTARELLENINREDKKVAETVSEVIPQVEKLVEAIVPRIRQGGRVFYIGAGTSGRLGILDASEIPPTFGAHPDLFIGIIAGGDTAIRSAVEGAEDNPEGAWEDLQSYNLNSQDTIIGVAASGRTPYAVGGLQKAREQGLLTACITCNQGAPVTEVAEIPIVAEVGPEFVTGSTRMKAGTAQKLILNMISTTVMIKLGKVKGNKMVDMQLANKKLVDRGTRMILEELGGVDYTTAQQLLLKYGSVRKALEGYRNEGCL